MKNPASEVSLPQPLTRRTLQSDEPLIRNRNKERMHLRDLIDVGLIDRSWLSKLPTVLAERLQVILDTPDG